MAPTIRRRLVWLTAFAAAGFAALVGLGVWQLQRLEWKEGLIARIQARAVGEPVALDEALRRWNATGDVEYLRIRFEGRFRHDEELHLYAISNGEAGWRIVTPLLTPDGHTVLVDRGFVPLALKTPAERAAGQVEGAVAITGLARAPESQALFVPDNDIAGNVWYWRDLDAMAEAALGIEQRHRLVPFFVEAEAGTAPGGWPRGGVTRLDLPNRHLEYALTWFGLAAALTAVYLVFVFDAARKRA